MGYVTLVGSPGSGKSTLLTRTLREVPHRIVRYYAYVRDAVTGSLRRGEAVNFFHDLTIALGRAGLRSGSTLPLDDLDLLIERFYAQLALAHEEWRSDGKRTIILVDGLDHIPREQRPTHSLLSHLPHPESVPDGVLFVLGTQTDRLDDISARIRQQLDEPGRRIVMGTLDRRAVHEIVDGATDLAPAPTPTERERIFALSGGHPLALNYVINRLRHSNGANVDEILDAVQPFHEGIDAQYATIWGTVESDFDLTWLLALLARTRGAARLDWVRRWAPSQALHTVTTRLAYLFRAEHGARWTFFHNSFRAYLIERTRELPALGGDAELFRRLADQCAAAGNEEPERGEELYYAARAGETARAISLAQPITLREQFIAGRSASTILDDLAFAFDAAVMAQDIIALTRILLCSAEFSRREYYAETLPLAEMWLEFGDVDLAIDALREGAALRTSREAALEASESLAALGFVREAKDIYTLAEPLDVLSGTAERFGGPQNDAELLGTWISVAPHFRPLPEILEIIDKVRAHAEGVWPQDESAQKVADERQTIARQYRLLQGLAAALDDLDRWDEADVVLQMLRSRNGGEKWWFWAQSRACHAALANDQPERAELRFRVLTEAQLELDATQSVALASGYLRLFRDIDAARRLTNSVEQPSPVSTTIHGDEPGWQPFQQRFLLNRVLGALGDARPLDEIVPSEPSERQRSDGWDEGDQLSRHFERGVVQLARLSGKPLVGSLLTPPEFESQARTLVRLFPEHPQLVRGSYVVLRAREEFYTLLVRAASKHESGCVHALQVLFEEQWSDEKRRGAWPDALIRSVLGELLSAGAESDWVRSWLSRIEPTHFDGESLESDLSDAVKHARAWLGVSDVVSARTTFKRALQATFGLEGKDDQLNSCLKWLVLANREDPAQTPERISRFAAGVAAVGRSDAQSYVAEPLLRAALAAGAPIGRHMVQWSLRNGVQTWVDAVSVFLDGLSAEVPAAAGVLSACYRTLVMPFSRVADTDAVSHISDALRASHENSELKTLKDAIEVVALSSTRPPLRLAVEGRFDEAIALSRRDEPTEPNELEQKVDAFDGLSLTVRELHQRVQSVTDVQDLARRLRSNAYSYKWETILAPFLAKASGDELVGVAGAIPINDYSWKVLANIAERLLVLGDPRAPDVVGLVVKSSRAPGWWRRYDGGSRLTAFSLHARVSPVDGRVAALQALRNDIAAGEVRPLDVFHDWPEIVGLISPEASAVDIWNVVSAHVDALVAHLPPSESTPTLPPPHDPTDAVAAITEVCNLVEDYLDHPAYALARGAQQFFVDRLSAGDTVAESRLVRRLVETNKPKAGALLVFRALARVRGISADPIHDTLRALLNAPDYRDRRVALELLQSESARRDGIPQSGSGGASTVQLPLPAVFNIEHPPAPPPRTPAPLARGAMLEQATDAATLVSLFRSELDLIALWAGVQPEALYAYVAERATARLPAGSQRIEYDDEPALRDEMSSLGLEVTYRRPRPRRVESAMAEAAAMLLDHKRLDTRYLRPLDRVFRSSDPYFLLARPQRRPESVVPIPERIASKYVRDDWTTGVTADKAAVGRTVGPAGTEAEPVTLTPALAPVPIEQWLIVAEETWLCWIDWSLATETRVGVRLEPKIWMATLGDDDGDENEDDIDEEIAAGNALSEHLVTFSHLVADEYLPRAGAAMSLVVRNSAYRFETPGGSWLAFNPALAEYLNWRPAKDGLFRWIDESGNVMAESIWWEDGFKQMRPPLFEEEVGYGWLVRVSSEAWRQLAPVVSPSIDWQRVARTARKQPHFVAVRRLEVA